VIQKAFVIRVFILTSGPLCNFDPEGLFAIDDFEILLGQAYSIGARVDAEVDVSAQYRGEVREEAVIQFVAETFQEPDYIPKPQLSRSLMVLAVGVLRVLSMLLGILI
jgi:hypothetical protein